MSRRAALLPTSLLFTLAACVGGEKDPADGDSTDGGADGAADGGAADGGADGGGGGTVRAQARVQLQVQLPDGGSLPLVGAEVALGAEGPPADGVYPCVDDDLDGVVSCAAEVDARATSLVACWRSPEGAEGCAEPVAFDGATVASRAEEGTGRVAPVEIHPEIVAPDTAVWGKMTLADGFRTYSCLGQPELCTDKPTVSVRGPDGGSSRPVPVGRGGEYLLGLSGEARPAEATLAVEIGESGPLTAYPAPAGGEQGLMLNEPALQIWAEVLEVDAGTVRIGLRAETRALGREGVVRAEVPVTELRVVATPNWRGSAELTEEGVLWTADPEAPSQALKVCAARGYATACAPVVRLLTDGAGGVRLAGDNPTQAYAAVGADGEPVEGARISVPSNPKDLFLATPADEAGEAYLDGPVNPRSVWAWAPGHAPGMIYDEGGEPGMRAEATPIRLVPTYTDAELVATDVRGGINYATADGRLSFTLPTDSLMDDAGLVRRPYKVRLAVVDPGETHPTPLDITERELSVLTPKISVYIGFEEEDGRPIVARFNSEVSAPTLNATFADGSSLPEKMPSFGLQPSDRSSWTRNVGLADPAGGGSFNLTIPQPGWHLVAEEYDPGHCVAVYVDEQAGYDTLWFDWDDPFSAAAGSGSIRIRSNPVLLYNLPDWADVDVTLGNKYGPDLGMPEASASLRATAPGRRISLYDEPVRGMEDCPAVTLPTVPTLPSDDHFFTRMRLGEVTVSGTTYTADQLAQGYYDTIDPSGLSTTLTDWKANACAWPASPGDAHATYQNLGDLGFVRDMYSYTDPATGNVCMYVTNYDSFAAWGAGAAIATVAMEWSPAPGVTSPTAPKYTKFYVFSADGNSRLLSADLDGNGSRAVPQLCMNCHGGDNPSAYDIAQNGWPNQGDVGARFLPFDPAAYGYLHSIAPGVPSGLTRADQEDDLRALNEDVLSTAVDPETRALIHLWYGSTATSSNTLPAVAANPHAVPTAWGGSPTDREAWVEVVQPRCLLCHMSLNDNWDWDAPGELAGWGNYIHTLVSENRMMPHARRPFQNLYSSRYPHETTVLEDFFYARGGWTDPSTGDPLECSF
ncbi:MAG: hypothetical protein JNM72_21390 [Deltaproteobacteria bacterium]|nr:hypothetical protein [Deltaproteobacteria bacterium]